MKKLSGISNISLTQKICLAGLFIAMATILQKVIAINYLAALPFFRLSFGAPAVIVFSSIYLGPFWGAAVGLFSDVLGYFAFDASSFAYMPQISLIYMVLGLIPFFIFKLLEKISKEKVIFFVEIGVLLASFIGLSCYLIFVYECSQIAKILIPIGLFILIGLLVVFQYFANSSKHGFYAPIKVSFTYFISDLLALVVFGGLMKAWAFSATPEGFWSLFKAIEITQGLVMIFNVVFNTLLLATFFRIGKKYMR
ncbi:MAG: hypothetical protein MJZ37_04765 [Bacilli bacterium]|nr:hypothetical protein [Bacilli bacterium]